MEYFTVEMAKRQRTLLAWICWAMVLVVGLAVILFALRTVPSDQTSAIGAQASGVALLVLVIAIGAAAVRPVFGLYSIVFFTLIGDSVTTIWFPFAKNFSSQESLLYVSDKLTFSPLEILIDMTLLFWIIEVAGNRETRVVRGPLFGAVALFTAFVAFGFVRGLLGGGDLRIALFEGRAIFILPLVYILAINLCTPTQLRGLGWLAMSAIGINSVLAINFWNQLPAQRREVLEDLGEHSASVHLALLVLFTLTLWLYRGGSRVSRLLMTAMCVPGVVVFLIAQRRSAAVGFGVGLIFLLVSLAWRHRVKFMFALPLVLVGTVGYTAAFWNSTGTAGFPAQAIKSVISPTQVTEKDRSSDLYRLVENFDINFTIRSSPLTGLGFGQPFLTPATLPDISSFEFYRYIPHNSIMWIWIKTGFLGFFSMIAMFVLAIRLGVRSLVRAIDPTNAAFIMMGIMYVAMFAVYAFVDIAWDPRSMVMLALAFALCTSMSPRVRVARPNMFRGVVLDREDVEDDYDDDDQDEHDHDHELVLAAGVDHETADDEYDVPAFPPPQPGPPLW